MVSFYHFLFLHTVFQIPYSPSPSSPYKVHSNNTCFSVSTSPHRNLSSSYFHVILSLPLTGKHPPLTISLTPAPTFPSAKLSFLGHSFICTYSFSLSVSLNPFFHTCLPTSLILLQMCFFQNSQFTFIPNFTIPFKLTSLNQIRFTNSKSPNLLHICLHRDPSLLFNKHSQYVAERVSGRNNILKALAGTSWGQQKETLLMTYKAVGRSIINYAAPVWSPNLHDTNYRKIQYTQNEALRIATGCHKMSSVDHLHTEADMLKVREHSELLSAQYLARCLEPGNVCHPITTRAAPERRMKQTLYTKHRNTVEPMMVKNDRKATLQALHTDAVDKAVRSQERNVVLDGRPPPISSSEKELSRRERSTLTQLRSGHCRLLGSYKSRIKKDASLNVCSDCGTSPHDVTHLFT